MRSCLLATVVLVVLSPLVLGEEYETGGPLAGVKLSLWATQHGEPAGHPGALPAKVAPDEADKEGNVPYTSQGQAPELMLHAGSVEHYRTYMHKYMPVRSFFDRQSQIRFVPAAKVVGVEKSQIEEYAAPVYWVPRHKWPVDSGLKLRPVQVVRCKTGSPRFEIQLGELGIGLYAIRVIGAVETKALRDFREPLYLKATVNDGPAGEVSTFRMRVGYCDEFYSIAEVYFHALSKRSYTATLMVDAGSKVDLLVHSISLDDVLAGTQRRAIKTRNTLREASPIPEGTPRLSKEERLARDAAIWDFFPPINAQPCIASGHGNIGGITFGSDTMSAEQIEEKFGKWEMPKTPQPGVVLVNSKLNLKYTTDDLMHRRALPDPYPLKDEGAGLFFPDSSDPRSGKLWNPIGVFVSSRWREGERAPLFPLPRALGAGAAEKRHDAAVALVRYAFAFPSIDAANAMSSVARESGPFGRDYRCRRRETTANFMDHYPNYLRPLYVYDQLFDTIQGNQALADSVSRFVPWVKSPKDVIQLLDVYLVQTTAKRIMRYHYHTDPMEIANAAAVLGDNEVTDPWMQWLFTRTFIYPLPVVGIQDAMITGCCRDGCEYIGSTYYAQGEGAARTARALERYIRAGGNPKYNLSDRSLYPKPVAQCYWQLQQVVAGGDFLRVGDVTGPDKVPGATLRDVAGVARAGWEWTHDPVFAFVLKHYGKEESTPEIDAAAAKIQRAPWLDNRSRVLPMWAGVLETGLQHDDMRFRRAAYLRVGFGTGHEHADSLDLQVVAHGLPATVDGGQRSAPRYSSPADHSTRVHNVVQVDGKGQHVYSWVRTLSDAPGARYLMAEAVAPGGAKHYSRQTALIDVDEGRGSTPLEPKLQMPGAKLPAGITTGNSYVFDVVRVTGGQSHAYCFHGMVNDEFEWNALNAGPVKEEADAAQLAPFNKMPEKNLAGRSPETLEVTWRQIREKVGRGFGSESAQLGANFDASAPRRFTRLHLFDMADARALKGEMVCFQWGYNLSCLMATTNAPEGQALDRPYAAIVEPYIGQPFVIERTGLSVDQNESDARRAVAVAVKTANGHQDLCFSDGRPERLRQISGQAVQVAGEFAYYSVDGDGLRQAALTGGTRLVTPLIRIEAPVRQRTAKVTRVDYLNKTMWIDQPWAARSSASHFEIGVPDRMTTYTARAIQSEAGGAMLMLTGGADYFRSPIESVDSATGTVRCVLPLTMGERQGINRHWVASNDSRTMFWRADVVGRGVFKLTGDQPVTKEAFGAENVLRLWEYGVGDELRQSTAVSVRRLEPPNAVYEVVADVDVVLSFKGAAIQISSDGNTWMDAVVAREGDWAKLPLKSTDAIDGARYIRVMAR